MLVTGIAEHKFREQFQDKRQGRGFLDTHVLQGRDAINLVRVECVGSTLRLSVNGHLLTEVFEEGSELATREITYQVAEAEDEKELMREKIREKIKGLKPFRRI